MVTLRLNPLALLALLPAQLRSSARALSVMTWVFMLGAAGSHAQAKESPENSAAGQATLASSSEESDLERLSGLTKTGTELGSQRQAHDGSWLFEAGRLQPLLKSGARSGLPKVDVAWVDPQGKVSRKSLLTVFRWVWIPVAPDSNTLRPVLRTFVILPKGAELESVSSSTLERVGAEASEWKMALKTMPEVDEDQVVVLQGLRSQATASLSWSEGGRQEQIGFIVRLSLGRPMLWSHSSCVDRGIVLGDPRSVRSVADEASGEFSVPPFLGAFIHCQESDGLVKIALTYSPDAKWKGGKKIDPVKGVFNDIATPKPSGTSEQPETVEWDYRPELVPQDSELKDGASTEIAAIRLEEGVPQVDTPRSTLLGVIRSQGWEGRLSSPLRMGLSWSAGLGVSSINYIEDAGETAEVQQTSLTLTGGVLWRFHPRWDLSATGFVNGLDLAADRKKTVSGSSTSLGENQSRFYGLNTRVGWRFSSPRGSLDWRLAGGFYFWGMLVDQPTYGVQSLLGPQFFVNVRNNQKLSRPWGAYVKYAVTGNNLGFVLSNNEVAVGGDVQITRILGRPLSATLDLSRGIFADDALSKNMDITTISLGTRVQF